MTPSGWIETTICGLTPWGALVVTRRTTGDAGRPCRSKGVSLVIQPPPSWQRQPGDPTGPGAARICIPGSARADLIGTRTRTKRDSPIPHHGDRVVGQIARLWLHLINDGREGSPQGSLLPRISVNKNVHD